jgi:predicted dehydrogenase
MRVGIIGAGSMGHAHARGWLAAGANLVGVAARTATSAASLAEPNHLEVFASNAALIEAVDIVDICAPTDLHKDLVLAAAAAGKHVLCEKPLALTVADAEAMIAACERAGVRLFVGMVVRFFPQYRAAQRALAAGRVGELGVLRLKRVAYQPTGDEGWFGDEARSGGLLLDLMIHDFDAARWFGGEVVRVYARSVRGRSPDAPGDYALATLRFASGAMALIEGGWVYPPGVFRTAFDLSGGAGALEWSSDAGDPVRTFLHGGDASAAARVGIPSSGRAADPYSLEIAHAYRAITDGTPFAVTARDSLEALRIALAALTSLRTGRPVELRGAS